MKLQKIYEQIDPIIIKIKDEIDRLLSFDKPPKINDGKYLQVILSRLRLVLGNPKINPIMKYEEAIDYYFTNEKALEHTQKKYMEILELQNYIVERTALPFIYDKYTILKMLNITLNTYNEIMTDAQRSDSGRDEDICNIFIDIDTMLLNDRIASAENGTKNFKAIDAANKYKTKNGGYGVVVEKEKHEFKEESKIINAEVVQQKIAKFGFSKMLDNNDNNIENKQ